jgi:hypothetical protein
LSGLGDAIAQVQTTVLTVTGIKAAPSVPPEQLSGEFPFSVAYPGEGNWTEAVAGLKQILAAIVVEIHFQRGDLPSDVTAALGYGDSIPNALFKKLGTDKFGGTISAFSNIRYTFGSMDWGSIKTIGWRFFLEGVKIQSAVT